MRRAGWAGIMTLVACLVVVGLIRAAVPEELPDEYEVRADDAGVARTDEATVEMSGIETASSIRMNREFSDDRFEATDGTILVLGRFKVTAHRRTFMMSTQIRTADGSIYEELPVHGFPQPGPAHVGVAVTTTFIYEIPRNQMDAVVGIHGFRQDGLQPVAPVMIFPLPATLEEHPGEVMVEDDLLEPVS